MPFNEPKPIPINGHRLAGLDSLRALAIIIVLLYHYKVVVSNEDTFGYITQIGWMGVDLFFVLSGYLICNQILQVITQKDTFSLRQFYMRRLLRTLPNYYAVCLLYFICSDTLTGIATAPWWQFLTFTQNFSFRPMATFTHSWSLCIEEQFYLLVPLIFMLIAGAKRQALWAWLIIIIGMSLGLAARMVAWFSYGQSSMSFGDYYQHIYYSSFTRFDELLPGIAIAVLKNFHAQAFNWLLNRANLILATGVIIFGILIYAFPHCHHQDTAGFNFLLSTLGYSILALSFALITCAALAPNSVLAKWHVPGAAQIALWSYAIYLIHKPLFKLLIAPLAQMNINSHTPLGISIIMGLSVFAGWLLFKCVETPFMIIRARYTATTASTLPIPHKNIITRIFQIDFVRKSR
ncbi:MAG TPA: acyltransferase [Cellvibrionaceae bacterium]